MGGEEERVMEGNVIKIYTHIKSSKINKNIKKESDLYRQTQRDKSIFSLMCGI